MTTLSYNKLCSLEDFSDPELRRVMRRELPHEVARFGDGYPTGREDRKDWETAMADANLRAPRAPRRQTRFSRCRGRDRAPRVLLDAVRPSSLCHRPLPGARGVFDHRSCVHAPRSGQPLAVGLESPTSRDPHMNALNLLYEDDSFDGVFSISSVEHFGDYESVRRAMDEIFRVLWPGASLRSLPSTDCAAPHRVSQERVMFDGAEVEEHLIGDRAWKLLSPLDVTVSDETLRAVQDVKQFVDWQNATVEEQGGLLPLRPEYPQYPVIALKSVDGHVSTTVHLALRKKRRNPVAHSPPAGGGSRQEAPPRALVAR
jgi:Methyltransferase domain